jgi:branched-chain amino acid transport system permease protein
MNKNANLALYGLLFVAGLAAPLVVYPVLMMKLLCFALFACAFNLLIGYTGLLSFGHAAFLGGAGYVAGYVIRDLGTTPEIGILLGTGFAALIGLVMGWLAIRRTGIYFTMITLALAQMLYFVWLQAPFTGGEDGLQGVPRGKLFGVFSLQNDVHLYYLVFAVFVFGFWLVRRTIQSPFGQVLQAIKENEPRAISLGYDVARFKLLAFVLSAALSGLAGSTKVLVMGFETLTDAQWTMSGTVVLMTLVGGMGTLLGPVVGAFFIMILENKMGEIGTGLAQLTGIAWFNQLGESVTIVTGFIFVLCVMAFRRGIVGEVIARWPRRRRTAAAPASA